MEIADNILKEETSFVGCSKHVGSLTKAVINIYAIRRAQVISKKYAKMYDEARKQEKSYRKRSKLVTAPQKEQNQTQNLLLKQQKKAVQRRIKKVPKSSQSIPNKTVMKKNLKRL